MIPDAPRILDAAQMAAFWIEPDGFVEAIETALRQYAKGQAVSAPKVGLYPPEGGLFHAMPAVLPDLAIVKWLAIGRGAEGNIQATILATDPKSGRLLAMLDAARLTDLRTAAVSVLAMRRLVDPEHHHTLGIIGCGRQAIAHLELLPETAPWIRDVLVWSPNVVSVNRLIELASTHFESITARESPQHVLMESDIVLSATRYSNKSRNLLRPDWLKPSALVLGVDLKSSWDFSNPAQFGFKLTDDRRHMEEMIASGIVPDVGKMDGDLLELLTGSLTLPVDRAGPTLFLPPGLSIADAGAVKYVLDNS